MFSVHLFLISHSDRRSLPTGGERAGVILRRRNLGTAGKERL